MALKHEVEELRQTADLLVAPLYSLEAERIPRHKLTEYEMPPDVAYQIVHDELMLDGNARLNVATFVSTWMEPQAEKLMAECLDKNMIDKDEYPQTAALETRCVNILADLWHAPDQDEATGCSTTGSSEAAMLAGSRSSGAGASGDWPTACRPTSPNIVMGTNVQVCWEKFANYWDVEMRLVPMEGDRYHLSAEEAVARCDENTIGVVAILGSTFDGSYEPVADICAALDAFEQDSGIDVPVHVDGASGGMFAPFVDPDLVWDFQLPRVASINTSGHKYGLVYPGVGWIVWRDADALPEELIFRVNYLGDTMPTFALNFSRPGAQVVAAVLQLPAAGLRGLPAHPAVRAGRRDRPRGPARRARAVRPPHARRRAAGLRVRAEAGNRQLQRLRPLARAARARLAGARVHVPREPHRPRGSARRRAPRVHARHGRPPPRGREAAAAAARETAGADPRRRERERFCALGRLREHVDHISRLGPRPTGRCGAVSAGAAAEQVLRRPARARRDRRGAGRGRRVLLPEAGRRAPEVPLPDAAGRARLRPRAALVAAAATRFSPA